MAEPTRLGALEVGEQGTLAFQLTGKTASAFTLALVGAGQGKQSRGTLVFDRVTAPYAITGDFAGLEPGDQPADFKVLRVVFDVNVGDEVVTTDGVHYVVQVVGSEQPGSQLPNGYWSPSSALRPQFTFGDIARNLGQA